MIVERIINPRPIPRPTTSDACFESVANIFHKAHGMHFVAPKDLEEIQKLLAADILGIPASQRNAIIDQAGSYPNHEIPASLGDNSLFSPDTQELSKGAAQHIFDKITAAVNEGVGNELMPDLATMIEQCRVARLNPQNAAQLIFDQTASAVNDGVYNELVTMVKQLGRVAGLGQRTADRGRSVAVLLATDIIERVFHHFDDEKRRNEQDKKEISPHMPKKRKLIEDFKYYVTQEQARIAPPADFKTDWSSEKALEAAYSQWHSIMLARGNQYRFMPQ
jgi:hypothetical protein